MLGGIKTQLQGVTSWNCRWKLSSKALSLTLPRRSRGFLCTLENQLQPYQAGQTSWMTN